MYFQSLLITVMTFYLRMMISFERKIIHKVIIYNFNAVAA